MKTINFKRPRPPRAADLAPSELALPYKHRQGYYNLRKPFFDAIVEQEQDGVSLFAIKSHNPSAEAEALRAACRGLTKHSRVWTNKKDVDPDHKDIASRVICRPTVGQIEIEIVAKK